MIEAIEHTETLTAPVVGNPLPPVVPDWETQIRDAERIAKLIDRHLDFEAGLHGRHGYLLRPVGLCPEQRVGLITDVQAVVQRY